ncbi:little elongation complex subunit 2 isoform X2 [Tachyglossus aculeatus]|uniref:little elongation complex subunit 2 isoform X2 n=1 Tax=Tachyglossus aculeatus TaxID=9261 RepID=UPI0018F609CE|nr:little elongation complex subunit 2 isoform X2 [Tachyglossus aculeatus]
MAASVPLLTWDVSPKNGANTFFSREMYEEYSLGPTLTELHILSTRQVGENVEAPANPVENEPTTSAPAAAQAKVEIKNTKESIPLPQPRIPYPYFSCLTEGEQKTYVYLLNKYSKKPGSYEAATSNKREYFQYLTMKERVSGEVAEFLKFLQNAAKNCAQDYDTLSEDGILYTEHFLRVCIEQVKKYPECYVLHDTTSLMGGKFGMEMALKLEKNLLMLGNAKFVKVSFPAMPADLPVDYKSITTMVTPEQRAAALHDDISKDPNAEKLALKYHPHVALNRRSLFTLLNNHGPDYKEQWEIPVCVKMAPITGSKLVKVVYVDSPLPRKEMTVREKNQIFHEIPLEFLMSKKSFIPVSAVLMDKPEENPFLMSCDDSRSRSVETSVLGDLGFDDDVTELETFGVTAVKPSKTSNVTSPPTRPVNPPEILLDKLKVEKQLVASITSSAEKTKSQEDHAFSKCSYVPGYNRAPFPLHSEELMRSESDDASSFKCFESDENESDEESGVVIIEGSNAKLNSLGKIYNPKKGTSVSETDEIQNSPPDDSSDTDEERLIIDEECKNHDPCKVPNASPNSNPTPDSHKSSSSSPGKASLESVAGTACSEQKKCVSKKVVKRLYKECDPVGQILKMQTELLKPPFKKVAEQNLMNFDNPKQPVAPSVSEQPDLGASTTSFPKPRRTSVFQEEKERLLPDDLQFLVEDKSQYVVPEEGNVVYKLFSLQDQLLLIRCSVQKVQTRSISSNQKKIRKQSPVFVLPKLEYQACYGVEALTQSELCQLWTESLLHSNCSFYVGHIDAFTSRLFFLEEIPMDMLKEKFATLMSANAFNILQHILKKITDLQEGSYLLSHATGDSSVSIYKSSNEKATRTAYNLHKAHCSIPSVSSSLSVPWLPLDPTVLLPYHLSHKRAPCTFPPKPQVFTKKGKVDGTRVQAPSQKKMPISMETEGGCLPAQQAKNKGVAKGKKKNNKKRANKWKKWQSKAQSKPK